MKTFWRTLKQMPTWWWCVVAVVALNVCCASAPKQRCVTTACGDVCCNDDGKLCPPCRR